MSDVSKRMVSIIMICAILLPQAGYTDNTLASRSIFEGERGKKDVSLAAGAIALDAEIARAFSKGEAIAFKGADLAEIINRLNDAERERNAAARSRIIRDIINLFVSGIRQERFYNGFLGKSYDAGQKEARRYMDRYLQDMKKVEFLRDSLAILLNTIQSSSQRDSLMNRRIVIFTGKNPLYFTQQEVFGHAGIGRNSIYLHVDYIEDSNVFMHLIQHEDWHLTDEGKEAVREGHAWQSREEHDSLLGFMTEMIMMADLALYRGGGRPDIEKKKGHDIHGVPYTDAVTEQVSYAENAVRCLEIPGLSVEEYTYRLAESVVSALADPVFGAILCDTLSEKLQESSLDLNACVAASSIIARILVSSAGGTMDFEYEDIIEGCKNCLQRQDFADAGVDSLFNISRVLLYVAEADGELKQEVLDIAKGILRNNNSSLNLRYAIAWMLLNLDIALESAEEMIADPMVHPVFCMGFFRRFGMDNITGEIPQELHLAAESTVDAIETALMRRDVAESEGDGYALKGMYYKLGIEALARIRDINTALQDYVTRSLFRIYRNPDTDIILKQMAGRRLGLQGKTTDKMPPDSLAMKDTFEPLSDAAEQDISRKRDVWLKRARRVGINSYTIRYDNNGKKAEVNVKAKILRAFNDEMPDDVYCCCLGEDEDENGDKYLILIIDEPKDKGIPFIEEILYHEYRELYWMRQEGLSRRDAHILASAEQSLVFRRRRHVTPYHEYRITNLTIEEMDYILKERRDYYHKLYDRLGGVNRRMMLKYEETFRDIVRICYIIKRRISRIGKISDIDLGNLMQDIEGLGDKERKEIIKKIRRIESRNVSEKNISSVLSSWITRRQFIDLMGMTAEGVRKCIKSGIIKAYIRVGRQEYFHPFWAAYEYSIHDRNEKGQRGLKTRIQNILNGMGAGEINGLVSKICGIEGRDLEIFQQKDSAVRFVMEKLESWDTIIQMAERLGLSRTAIGNTVEKGEISSKVEIAGIVFLYPPKAIGEYSDYIAVKQRDASAERKKKSLVMGLDNADKERLRLFITAYCGGEIGDDDELAGFSLGLYSVYALAKEIGCNEHVVERLIEDIGGHSILLAIGNYSFTMIAPDTAEKIKRKVRGYLQDIEDWYRETFSEEIDLKSFADFRGWTTLEGLREIFPFLPRQLQTNRHINKIKIGGGYVKEVFVVPPKEIERMKGDAVNCIIENRNFVTAKKYGFIPEDMKKQDVDFETALRVIMEVRDKWKGVHFYTQYGLDAKAIRSREAKGDLDGIRLRLFSEKTVLYLPPHPIAHIEELDRAEFLRANEFLRKICGIEAAAGTVEACKRYLSLYCITISEICRRLGIGGRLHDSGLLKLDPGRIRIRLHFAGERVEYYLPKELGESFIRGEEEKLEALRREIRRYDPLADLDTRTKVLAYLKEHWYTIDGFAEITCLPVSAIRRMALAGDIPYVRINLFQSTEKIVIPGEARQMIDSMNNAVISEILDYLKGLGIEGAEIPEAADIQTANTLLNRYCMTGKEISERLGIGELDNIEKRFSNYRKIIFLGENVYRFYVPRKDGEEFLKAEEGKYEKIRDEVIRYGSAAVSVSSRKGLAQYLEANWLTKGKYAEQEGITAACANGRVVTGKVPYVRIEMAGFPVRVYIPPNYSQLIKSDNSRADSPDAIGKGSCLVRKDSVEVYQLDSEQRDVVREAIDNIRRDISKAELSDDERTQAEEAVLLLEEYFTRGDIVVFDALVNGPEDYLLAFPKDGRIALARDFLSKDYIIQFWFHRLPEILFHEGFAAGFGERDYEEHRSIYQGIQRRIFARDNLLKDDLRFYINIKSPCDYEIGLDDATLHDRKINLGRITELLSDREFIYRSIKRVSQYPEFLSLLKIGKIKVKHGGTGSQKQTLHISIFDEDGRFQFEFALKVAIDHAAQAGFAKSQMDEIGTLRRISGKKATPKFGIYVEEPETQFFAYTEEWISGPTAGEMMEQNSFNAERLSNVVCAYLSVMRILNTKNPWAGHVKYLGVSDVHGRNVMFKSVGSDEAVVVDIGKIVYITPLYALQEFDRYYARSDGGTAEGRKQCQNAIFDGVIKTFGEEQGIEFLEEALDRTAACQRNERRYKREETEMLAESLKEYLSNIYIKETAKRVGNVLNNTAITILDRLAADEETASIIEEVKLWFDRLYREAQEAYENDMALSNQAGLEVIQLVMQSISTEEINVTDLLNMPPGLDQIEKLLDISFLLGLTAEMNITYNELPDGRRVINLEATRPEIRKAQWGWSHSYSPKDTLDSLELNSEDTYLAVGGACGINNIAACLRGVRRSIYIDISEFSIPHVAGLKRDYGVIKRSRVLRDRIENERVDNIANILREIECLRDREAVEEEAALDFHIADVADMPLADDSVTKVSILGLFRWIRQQGGSGKVIKVMRETLRVTREGGLILVRADNPGEKTDIELFPKIAQAMGVVVRLKSISSLGARVFEVVSKGVDSYKKKRLDEAKRRIKGQIDYYDILKARIGFKEGIARNVLIDKECLPRNQQYLLEGEDWDNRRQLLERMFHGYRFGVFSGSLAQEMDRDNTIVLTSAANRGRYDELNARLVFIQNAGEEEVFPIDGLIYLGVGFLSVSEDDKGGSPLVSVIGRLYREITGNNLDIREFFNRYRLEIILPPIERFSIEDIVKIQSYATEVLTSA